MIDLNFTLASGETQYYINGIKLYRILKNKTEGREDEVNKLYLDKGVKEFKDDNDLFKFIKDVIVRYKQSSHAVTGYLTKDNVVSIAFHGNYGDISIVEFTILNSAFENVFSDLSHSFDFFGIANQSKNGKDFCSLVIESNTIFNNMA